MRAPIMPDDQYRVHIIYKQCPVRIHEALFMPDLFICTNDHYYDCFTDAVKKYKYYLLHPENITYCGIIWGETIIQETHF